MSETELVHISRAPMTKSSKSGVDVYHFPVNQDLNPYIVSGAASIALFVPNCSKHSQVRAAIRGDDLRLDFYPQLIALAFQCGENYKWGSSHPYTAEGIKAALDHVAFYDFPEGVELLLHPESGFSQSDLGEKYKSIIIWNVGWMPEKCAVAIPKDRSLVGGALLVGEGYVAVVHNLCRSLAVAWDQS